MTQSEFLNLEQLLEALFTLKSSSIRVVFVLFCTVGNALSSGTLVDSDIPGLTGSGSVNLEPGLWRHLHAELELLLLVQGFQTLSFDSVFTHWCSLLRLLQASSPLLLVLDSDLKRALFLDFLSLLDLTVETSPANLKFLTHVQHFEAEITLFDPLHLVLDLRELDDTLPSSGSVFLSEFSRTHVLRLLDH